MEIGQNFISCSRVRLSNSAITEIEEGKIVAAVPREQIKRIRLSHLTSTRHPFVRFFLGFTFVSVGLIFGIAAFFVREEDPAITQTSSYTIEVPLVLVGLWLMVGVGLWLLVGVFKGKYILLVDTEAGTRRICFDKSTGIGEIQCFMEKAREEFGYEIEVPTGNEPS